MAKGKTVSATIVTNNKVAVTTSKTVEQVLINGTLQADPNELNPGVNSRTM